jgi:hypothetical protein
VVASSSSPGRWPPARAREGWRCRSQWQPVVEGSPSTFSTQIPPQHKHRVRCEQLLLSFHFLIAKACYHPSFLDLQNSTQLLLDQAQDNKVVICKLNKQGHLWIFFKKQNDVRSFLDIHIRQQIIYL